MSPVLAGSTFIRPHLSLGYVEDKVGGVSSLPELIEFAAEHNPDHIFGVQIRAGEDSTPCDITFSDLQSAVEHASAWLISAGATTGRTQRDQVISPVGILLGSDISIFIYLAALLRLGTPALLMSARLTSVAIAQLLRQTSTTCVLINSQVSRASEEALKLLHADVDGPVPPNFLSALKFEDLLFPNVTLRQTKIPPRYTAWVREDLDAVIMHSSGTTGLPKPIYHSQTHPLIYAAAHRLPEQRDPFCFNVSTLPLYHGFGLLAPALSLSIGMPFTLPPASVVPTGKSILNALQTSGARYMFTVPSIVEEVLGLPGGVGLEVLQRLEIVAVGGASMKESVGSALAAAGVNLLNHWGCTELGAIAPIERIPRGYDWKYLMPRSDVGLTISPLNDGSNSYRLTGCPTGWKEPFIVQDLLEPNPHDRKQYRIMGRADDLLVLATGEKVRPTNLERTIAEHPDIKGVLAFGEGQLCLGLLVEIAAERFQSDIGEPEDKDAILSSIEPYLERGNSFTDKHGKVTKDMIVIAWESTKPFLRTDKGNLARKANLAAFDAEIRACYEHANVLSATPFPFPDIDNGHALLDSIRLILRDIMGHTSFGDDVDFFEAGMDSLQASRLRRSILTRLRATPNLPKPVEDLQSDFCFENSSVGKLHRAVTGLMDGTYVDYLAGQSKELKRIAAMEEMVEKYRRLLADMSCLAFHARISRRRRQLTVEHGSVILLTGSTGSLGCFLLARLAQDSNINKVICLNRPRSNSVNVHQRQMDLMAKRGISLSAEAWKKVVLHGVDMGREDFGLEDEEFDDLLSVTHIIHNAWPVDFNRNLSSFEPHVKALANLVRLSILSSGSRPEGSAPTRMLFTSSIAVAGRFPDLNPKGPLEVPEVALEAINSAEFGYPEAKWVCEALLVAAEELYGDGSSEGEPLMHGSIVRIGQMTGPEGSGAWNESEHFPIIVSTSQRLRALPAIDGSLSWLPVNRAGDVIAELLFSEGFKRFYHMENPSRQSWSGLLHKLASILGGPDGPLPVVLFSDWLDRVHALGEDPERNPAFKILGFLENNFVKMATGSVTLRTANTRLDSPTMVRSTSLDMKHLEEYINYWRVVGAMR